MTAPYTPVVLATPIVNPSTGGTGAPPISYISNSEFTFAPTALSTNDLVPKGSAALSAQSLADTIARASAWADAHCFGADAGENGASLAASLSVEDMYASVKGNGSEMRLICDYRPIQQVIGVDFGSSPASVASIGPTLAGMTRIGRRTIYVPFVGFNPRTGDSGNPNILSSFANGKVYAVWSYVNGYPHTSLEANVMAGDTSCVLTSTDGNGGVWGLNPAGGSYPGTSLTVYDGVDTERIFVQAIAANTPSTGQTTIMTSAFRNQHTIPLAPDFIPVSAMPNNIHQAVISLTSMLIKTRGSRALVMPTVPGGRPNRQAISEAGAGGDWDIAEKNLHPYVVRNKSKT